MTTQQKPNGSSAHAAGNEFFGGVWENAQNFQRQWLNFMTRPLGADMAPVEMWQRWHDLSVEWLEQVRKTSESANELTADQVKIMREFSDKALKMSKNLGDREPADITPEFSREWFEMSRKSFERNLDFGNDSMKAMEKVGLRMSDMLKPVVVDAK